jgi:gliding motility-associated-like protein
MAKLLADKEFDIQINTPPKMLFLKLAILSGQLMGPRSFNLFLFFLLISVTTRSVAQTCSGSLGDPVINQTFGAGSNPGVALSGNITNMRYTSDKCPNDGYYTIANSLTGNCYGTWHNVASDHTGNPNGYMMIVNASYQPSIFFTETANGLCPNTTYEFSAYILNVVTLAASGPDVIRPNITFSIETSYGQVLKTYDTGNIDPTAQPRWTKYATYFTTPTDVTDVVVKMTNNAAGGNGNDLILDDIAFRACGPIVQTGFGNLASTGPQNICEGSSTSYTLQATVGAGYNNPFLQWQLNKDNAGWTNIAGQTSTTFTLNIINAQSGTYQYRLAVGEGENISSPTCNVNSQPLTITVNPLPVAQTTGMQTVCESDALTLIATGGASYTWSGPNITASNQNPLVIGNVTSANAGVYTVAAISASGCASVPVKTIVKVVPKAVAVVDNNPTICAGETTRLSASGGLYYKWTPSDGLDHDDIANPTASPAQTTTYTVKVSNDGCYDDTKSVTVTVNQNPIANAGANKAIFEGQSVQLNGVIGGDNISSYYWTPTTGLDNPNSITPNASPKGDITYTLNVISQTCGTAASDVFVRVYKKITIPNAFTPNSDGINDLWDIDALVTYPSCLVTVFDRNGQKVYQSVGYPKPWDGTSGGSALPTGTYYYIIDLKNNTPKLSGWVVIIR